VSLSLTQCAFEGRLPICRISRGETCLALLFFRPKSPTKLQAYMCARTAGTWLTLTLEISDTLSTSETPHQAEVCRLGLGLISMAAETCPSAGAQEPQRPYFWAPIHDGSGWTAPAGAKQ
jgi:hypothetical protein